MAISVADGFLISRGGNKHPKKTTCGWELLPQMKEGFSKWVSLKDLKDSNPVKLYKYAMANKIEHKPYFAWWVTFTLQKCNRIVSKLQMKYWCTTHKCGILVPKYVKKA